MVYNLFPAVDDEYNFPQEVREQLAKSQELRCLIVPMSSIYRDSLSEDEKWVGRTIYNTSTKTLETLQGSGSWVKYLEDSYIFPTPPPLWDENYDLPIEVRQQLAKSDELKYLVVPMTTEQRNSLTTSLRWNGRVIYNTTTEKLEAWNSTTNTWMSYLDENYVFSEEFLDNIVSSYASNPQFKYMIVPTSEALKNNIINWDGRVIYNTTYKRLEVFVTSLGQWIPYLSENWAGGPQWVDFTPYVRLDSGIVISSDYVVRSRHLREKEKTTYCFAIDFLEPIEASNYTLIGSHNVEVELPFEAPWDSEYDHTGVAVGSVICQYTNPSQTLLATAVLTYASKIAFAFSSEPSMPPFIGHTYPFVIGAGCSIKGHIVYPTISYSGD